MNERLQKMAQLLKEAKAEYVFLCEETERLTKEESALHRIQQRFVYKRNAMQSVVSNLHILVSEMESEDAQKVQP